MGYEGYSAGSSIQQLSVPFKNVILQSGTVELSAKGAVFNPRDNRISSVRHHLTAIPLAGHSSNDNIFQLCGLNDEPKKTKERRFVRMTLAIAPMFLSRKVGGVYSTLKDGSEKDKIPSKWRPNFSLTRDQSAARLKKCFSTKTVEEILKANKVGDRAGEWELISNYRFV